MGMRAANLTEAVPTPLYSVTKMSYKKPSIFRMQAAFG